MPKDKLIKMVGVRFSIFAATKINIYRVNNFQHAMDPVN